LTGVAARLRSQSFPTMPSKADCIKKHPLCFFCSPNLKENDGTLDFAKACSLVAVALGDTDWWGRYRIDDDEADHLRKDVEAASKKKRNEAAGCEDGQVQLSELKDFAFDVANKEVLLKHASCLHGLMKEVFLNEVFKTFDVDNDKCLDAIEWKEFLDHLAAMNLEHLVAIGHVAFRAFFGRGQPWDLHPENFSWNVIQGDLISAAGRFGQELKDALADDETVDQQISDGSAPKQRSEFWNMDNEIFDSLIGSIRGSLLAPSGFQAGKDPDCKSWHPFPPGWWQDVYYYSANNHPLHGIFMCDPIHPLSWIERVCMEIATWGFTMGTSLMHRRWVEENHAPLEFLSDEQTFSMLMVTIPGLIVWWTLFLLFTCKRGQVNHAHSTQVQTKKAWWMRCVGASFAYFFCVAGVAYTIYFFVEKVLNKNQEVEPYLERLVIARLKSYLLFWFLIFFVYFNPLISWGTPDPNKPQTGIGDLIGLGQWRIEKQRFQVKCARVADMRQKARDV